MDAQVRPELRAQRLLPSAARRAVDIQVDITPLELALDYLAHLFPTQLHEAYSDEDGHLHARPVFDAHGQPVSRARSWSGASAQSSTWRLDFPPGKGEIHRTKLLYGGGGGTEVGSLLVPRARFVL